MEFLWVEWYGQDLDHVGGWKEKHPHHVGFVDGEDLATFGFLDPQEVIHGIHLIPAFAHGQFKSSYSCHKIMLKSTSVDCSKICSDGYK